jgi:hypothetical protein
MELARLENQKLKATVPGVTLLVAILGIVPPVVTAIFDRTWKSSTAALETAKLDLERDKAATALYQTVLASPDANQRQLMLRFLVKARVVDADDSIVDLPSEQIPQWPEAGPASAP